MTNTTLYCSNQLLISQLPTLCNSLNIQINGCVVHKTWDSRVPSCVKFHMVTSDLSSYRENLQSPLKLTGSFLLTFSYRRWI